MKGSYRPDIGELQDEELKLDTLDTKRVPDEAMRAAGLSVLKFAYADPPYLGQGRKHYAALHKDAKECDNIEWHRELIARLVTDYPDGWALSASSVSLRAILPSCPDDVRVGAWLKPFCSFKPGVNPAYAWEPVIWRGGRKRDRWEDKVRDYAAVPVTLRMGYPGSKPAAFVRWVLELLNAQKHDEIHDLFPGAGYVARAIEAWRNDRTFWEPNDQAHRPPTPDV